jgi:hypothetical protein
MRRSHPGVWGGLADRAVQAPREEAEIIRSAAQIDDAEHLARRAAEREGIVICRNNVGVAVRATYALIPLVAAVQAVPRVRDPIGGLEQATAEQDRSNLASVIRFDGEETGCRFKEVLVVNEARRTLVRRDANIFEYKSAEQEVVLVGIRIERLAGADQAGGTGGGGEAVAQVESRASAYSRMAPVAKFTRRPPVTPPRVPFPVVSSVAKPRPKAARK